MDAAKREYVRNEYDYLLPKTGQMHLGPGSALFQELCRVKEQIWKVKDDLREREKLQRFDDESIRLARSVCALNDERSRVNNRTNLAAGPDFVEEE